MMRFYYFLFVALIGWGCELKYAHDPIYQLPSDNRDVMSQSLGVINSEISKDPENEDLYLRKLELLESRNWWGADDEFMVKVAELSPENPAVAIAVADYYFGKGEFKKSLSKLNLAYRLGDRSEKYYLLRANIHYENGMLDKALSAVNTALYQYQSFDLLLTKGKILVELGDFPCALSLLEEGYRENNNNMELNQLLIFTHLTMGNPEVSEALYKVTVYQHQPEADWLYGLAKMKLDRGYFKQAKKDLSILYNRFPDDDRAQETLGFFYLSEKKYDSAIYMANRLLAVDSSRVNAHLVLARAYGRKFFYRSSIDHYERLLAIAPNHQKAQTELAEVQRTAYVARLRREQEIRRTELRQFGSIEKKTVN